MPTDLHVRTPDAQPEPSHASARPPAWVLVGSLLLAGIVGFLIGSARSDVMDLEGRASVGNHMATIESGGWFYGVSESVAWIDPSGSQHEDGWPTCLGKAGNTTTVKFGAVPVELPGGGSFRPVVYVDCRTG